MRFRFFALVFVAAASTVTLSSRAVIAQQTAPRAAATPSVEDRIAGLRKIDGYFPLYWDDRAGTLLLEIPRFDSDFLFSTGLSAGLGSNDIGLDRGGGGQGRVVRFHRVGLRSCSSNPIRVSARARRTRANGNRSKNRSRNRSCGVSRSPRNRTAECLSMPRRFFCATFMVRAGSPARRVARRPDAQRVLSAEHTEFSEEHRDRHDVDVHPGRRCGRTWWWWWSIAGPGRDRRRRRNAGRQSRRRDLLGFGRECLAFRRRGDAARARVVRRAAGRELQAAHRRSARRLRRYPVR